MLKLEKNIERNLRDLGAVIDRVSVGSGSDRFD